MLRHSGDCSNAVVLHSFGYPDKVSVAMLGEADQPVAAKLLARCRKCPECLAHRSNLWAARACAEMKLARRTWFGTLTMAPAAHQQLLALARRRYRRQRCEDFDKADASDQFKELAHHGGQAVTKFLKRIRGPKASGLRYLLVVEPHKSGLPHWHLLVHEYGEPISKRQLEAQWRSGFSHWRLVQDAAPQTAFYVSKYLTKSADARVRSSARYGRPRMVDLIRHVESMAALPEGSADAPACLNPRREVGSPEGPAPRNVETSNLEEIGDL